MSMRPFLVLFTSATLVFTGFANAATQKTKILPKKKITTTTTEIDFDDVEKNLEDSVQVEATTFIEATPLEKSTAAKLRDQRRDLEVQTEEEVVEEIESSRIADEKLRRERIFGNRIRSTHTVQKEVMVEDSEFAPMAASTNTTKTKVERAYSNDEADDSFYIGLGGGILNYPQADNITDNGALGFSLGYLMPFGKTKTQGLNIAGDFLYSYNQNEFSFGPSEDMDQYHVNGALKYFVEFGWFVPSVGVVLGYTRRQYDGGENNSNAFDAGVSVSGDIKVTKNIYFGGEYRYMTNLDYERDSAASTQFLRQLNRSSNLSVSNPEAIDYQILMINGKYLF